MPVNPVIAGGIVSSSGGGGGTVHTVLTVYNVKTYGAKGNGVTDDTTAIDDAVAAANDASGGIVYFPPGNYPVTGISITLSATKPLKILGAGQASIITNTSTTQSHAGCSFYVKGTNTQADGSWIEIATLHLVGNDTGGMGIYYTQVIQGAITNIFAKDFVSAPTYSGWGCGINLSACIDVIITNPVVTGCLYAGLQIGDGSNANAVIGGWIVTNTGIGINLWNTSHTYFVGTVTQGNHKNGLAVITGCTMTTFSGWIESNGITTGVANLEDNSKDSIYEAYFFGRTTSNKITIGATAEGITFRSCHFSNAPKITLADGSTNTQFLSCRTLAIADITDNSGGKALVQNCTPANPVGKVSVEVPSSDDTVAAVPYDRIFYVFANTLGAVTLILSTVGSYTLHLTASTYMALTVPAGISMQVGYSHAPSWTVQGL